MCGLIAVITPPGEKVDHKQLTEASNCLQHRGPDDEGIVTAQNVGLAHKRLSILDLSERGKQPMLDPNSDWQIIYNGEIYNFKQLRRQLVESGYRFQTETDTEVLLKGWHQWGESLLDKLNGMYAFVLWNENTEQLVVGRDPFGMKPLYTYKKNEQLIFASEQKAICRYLTDSPQLDPNGLNEYLTFQNFFSRRTLLQDIQTFPPGELRSYSADQPNATPETIHRIQLRFTGDYDGSRDQAVEELRATLSNAVKRHLVSDVPVNAYLSGGIDSSTIAALAANHSPNPLKTFTVGFDMSGVKSREAEYDERSPSREVAEAIGSEHYEAEVNAGTLEEVLPDLVHHLEEPRLGQSYPNYVAARLASQHGKVVLSGAGGDELFGGYPWRYQIAWKGNQASANRNGLYQFWNRLFSAEQRQQLISPDYHSKINFKAPKKRFQTKLESLPYDLGTEKGFLHACLQIELDYFLQGLVHIDDKLGMAFGLEARFPLLDRELVDLALSIPPRWKVDPYNTDQSPGDYRELDNGKVILREAMNELLPSAIQVRKKQGFSGPYNTWQTKKQRDYILKSINNIPFINTKTLSNMINLSSKSNALITWSILYFSKFQQHFID